MEQPSQVELMVGDMAWTLVQNVDPSPSYWCEAPRHAGKKEAPSHWMVRAVIDGNTVWQATCQTCMQMICDDLGVSPEQGATNV